MGEGLYCALQLAIHHHWLTALYFRLNVGTNWMSYPIWITNVSKLGQTEINLAFNYSMHGDQSVLKNECWSVAILESNNTIAMNTIKISRWITDIIVPMMSITQVPFNISYVPFKRLLFVLHLSTFFSRFMLFITHKYVFSQGLATHTTPKAQHWKRGSLSWWQDNWWI